MPIILRGGGVRCTDTMSRAKTYLMFTVLTYTECPWDYLVVIEQTCSDGLTSNQNCKSIHGAMPCSALRVRLLISFRSAHQRIGCSSPGFSMHHVLSLDKKLCSTLPLSIPVYKGVLMSRYVKPNKILARKWGAVIL